MIVISLFSVWFAMLLGALTVFVVMVLSFFGHFVGYCDDGIDDCFLFFACSSVSGDDGDVDDDDYETTIKPRPRRHRSLLKNPSFNTAQGEQG